MRREDFEGQNILFEVEVASILAPRVVESILFVAQGENLSGVATDTEEERKCVGGKKSIGVLAFVIVKLDCDNAGSSREKILPDHVSQLRWQFREEIEFGQWSGGDLCGHLEIGGRIVGLEIGGCIGGRVSCC